MTSSYHKSFNLKAPSKAGVSTIIGPNLKRGSLKTADPIMYSLVQREIARQREGIELISSENLVSIPVLEALGSVFTNQYSEGYPGKRYYAGNEVVDEVESLAIERAKKLFGAEHVNVQPYSGSPANHAVYFALLELGDPILAMKLDQGGHLTHGHKVNFSGVQYKAIQYGVDKETELLDYDEIEALAKEHKPKMIEAGFTAYSRTIDFKRMREIADSVGAYFWVDMAHFAGLVAGGAYPNPVAHAHVVTTTSHKTLRGPRGAMILCKEEFAKKIDRAVFPGLQGGPHDHTTAGIAVALGEALKPEFKEYAQQVVKNARALSEGLSSHDIRLVSGGTDTHLLLADLTPINMTGKIAEHALDKAGIYVNKNTIPYDPRSPWDPSGIRLGSSTVTTRGMKEKEMVVIIGAMMRVLENTDDETVLTEVKKSLAELCAKFPIYPELGGQ